MSCYRLRELIQNKYKRDGFEKGCEILAKWLSNQTQRVIAPQDIVDLCDAESETECEVSEHNLRAFQKFFGLESTNDFFTKVHPYPPLILKNERFEKRMFSRNN